MVQGRCREPQKRAVFQVPSEPRSSSPPHLLSSVLFPRCLCQGDFEAPGSEAEEETDKKGQAQDQPRVE